MTDSFKGQILDKIKFIFDKNDLMRKLTETIEQNDIAKKLNNMGEDMTEGMTEDMEDILNNIKNRETNVDLLFKKIKMLFSVVSDLIKFSIISVDKPEYKKVESEKIECPNNTDKLILIMGIYGDAFNSNLRETMYFLVNQPWFEDIYKISNINMHMIPFVTGDDKINVEKLKPDYVLFRDAVANLVCDILNVNTDFEEDSMFE